jgi:hypothetical protein
MMLFARHHKLHRYNIVLFSVSVFILVLVLLIVFYLYACCVKKDAKLSFPETANNDKINKPLPLTVATREYIGRKGSIIASLFTFSVLLSERGRSIFPQDQQPVAGSAIWRTLAAMGVAN